MVSGEFKFCVGENEAEEWKFDEISVWRWGPAIPAPDPCLMIPVPCFLAPGSWVHRLVVVGR